MPAENLASRCERVAKLIFGMMQSLDGYVDHLEIPPPGVALHRHFNDQVRGVAGSLYGRRMYEVMRYCDEDQPDWDAIEHDYAAVWRAQPKWVASRSLTSVMSLWVGSGEPRWAASAGLRARRPRRRPVSGRLVRDGARRRPRRPQMV
jgi:hypothetical protein